MELWTAFLIGLAGSLHCIGMCGPIVLALPGQGFTKTSFLASRILYNSGRMVSYMILGIVSGLLGAGIRMIGFQHWLSIGLGVLILLAVFLPPKRLSKLFPAKAWNAFDRKMKELWGKLFKRQSVWSLLMIGFLNGFLPCGLVYMAMAGAAVATTIPGSVAFMAMFGIGTFPIMLATSYAGNFISLKLRKAIYKLIPVGGVILAALLILRGLSLGIPYVSPKITMEEKDGVEVIDIECCH